jgi:hypothetical protein
VSKGGGGTLNTVKQNIIQACRETSETCVAILELDSYVDSWCVMLLNSGMKELKIRYVRAHLLTGSSPGSMRQTITGVM